MEVRLRYSGPIHAHTLALVSSYSLSGRFYVTLLREPRKVSYSGRNELLLDQEFEDHRGFHARAKVYKDVGLEPTYVRLELPSKGTFERGLLEHIRSIKSSGEKLLRARLGGNELRIYGEGSVDEYIQTLKELGESFEIEELERVERNFGRVTSLSERRRRSIKTYGTIEYLIEVNHEILDGPAYLVITKEKGLKDEYKTPLTQIYADAIYRKPQSEHAFVIGMILYSHGLEYVTLAAVYHARYSGGRYDGGIYRGMLGETVKLYGLLPLFGDPYKREREFFEKNIRHIVSYALRFEIANALEEKGRRTSVHY